MDPDTPITISEEHHQYLWLNTSDAIHQVFVVDMKIELRKCDTFLRQNLKL
jgi:hypothetical protein